MVSTHGRTEQLINRIHYMNWNTCLQMLTMLRMHYIASLNT